MGRPVGSQGVQSPLAKSQKFPGAQSKSPPQFGAQPVTIVLQTRGVSPLPQSSVRAQSSEVSQYLFVGSTPSSVHATSVRLWHLGSPARPVRQPSMQNVVAASASKATQKDPAA